MSVLAHFTREIIQLGGVSFTDLQVPAGTPLTRVQLETFELAQNYTDALSLDGEINRVLAGTTFFH